MGGIFINYRTGDGDWAATLIARELTTRFGADNVFFASRSIRLGEDFAESIVEGLLRSDVLLAVIGHRWATITGPDGRPRVQDPEDWVHREIAESFKRDIRVIPVFLDGRGRLSEEDLPAAISRLARCQYLRLHHRNDDHDIARLLDELTGLVPAVAATAPASPAVAEPRPLGECPYRGLQPFREQDAGIFHGRDRELDRLAQLTAHRDTVLVAGPSGSGKSSLVRAGLWPRLRAEGAALAVFRPIAGVPARQLLAAAMKPVLGPDWEDRLAESDPAVLAGSITAEAGDLVLCVDQFEELAATDPAAATELFDLITRFVRAAPSRPGGAPALRAVYTVRSAQLDQLRSPGLTQALEEATVHVRPMTPEQLHAVITKPAETAGASFEPGLAERISTDAADAPGQLPLVEFTLTRLWESGALTHQAYDELGGVAGALAGYAEEVYTQRLSPESRALTEGLLTQLARPAPDGGFRLSPARFDQLTEPQQALAAELAAARLVVIRQDVDQPEVVALAHETLVHAWQRLHTWLLAAAEFRTWQEQLRVTLAQWQDGRDPGSLLRGAPLATAEQWLTETPERLAAVEREYIATSRTYQRRGIRRLRVITAVAVTAALVAGLLAVVVQRRGSELAHRLDDANATLLAQLARRVAKSDPMTALQAAQAAWRTRPGNDEAYGALLEQFLPWQHVEKVYPPRPGFAPDKPRASADGRVVAVVNSAGKDQVVVWPEGDPGRPWVVRTGPVTEHRVSPDGRLLVVMTHDGALNVWNIAERTGPLPLRPATPHTTSSVRISSDNTTVTVLNGFRHDPQTLFRYDLRTRQALPGDQFRPSEVNDLLPMEGGVAVLTSEGRYDITRVVLRDVRTGAAIRTYPPSVVLGNGAALATCEAGTVRIVDTASGERHNSGAMPNCKDLQLIPDASGEFLRIAKSSIATDSALPAATRNDLFHWRSGQLSTVRAPMLVSGLTGPTFVAHKETSGAARLLAVDRDIAARIAVPRPSQPPAPITASPIATDLAIRPGAQSYIRAITVPKGWELTSFDASTGAVRGTRPITEKSPSPTRFTPDGSRVLSSDGTALHVLDGGDLALQRSIALPKPPVPATPSTSTTVAVLSNSEAVVSHGGQLTRWNLDSGERIGDPLPLAGNDADLRRYATQALIELRPQHPGQVVLQTHTAIEVWDLGQRRRIRELPVRTNGFAVVDPTGTKVLARNDLRKALGIWDLDRAEAVATLETEARSVAGFDGPVLVTTGSGSIQAWRWENSQLIAETRTNFDNGIVEHRKLHYLEQKDAVLLTLDLDPDSWFRRLCQVNDREFTERERLWLPVGANTERPCG
ncbi:TIR domain-containing protein [Crossiella sp. SN42]|uniref:nSTAND1 domain-containing NTPase n=1 Tax=Crossiella sp. SN42 TaxID=2944808 RepID=UPI00207C1948|nr:TIR domain-containing protein [Crossiella sp. SN42]MCO1574584.1 TIR domain-containing protein [Crossiella sp. SN42]